MADVKREIMTLAKFKPNPNHYIIVDKWNRKEYNKVKFKIFDIIEKEIDKRIVQNWVEYFAQFASFPSTIETPIDFWEIYKQQLPLWSNINTNRYFKLKEN
jgi:hypothetical protein